jgi:hypothetical protein
MVQLTPGKALFVIERLIADKKVTRTQVEKIAGQLDQEISTLERRLAMLRGGEAVSAGAEHRGAQKRPTSAATAASRRLQGQYLGLIRQIPAAQRGRFKKVAATKGRELAVRMLRAELAKR